MDSATEMDSYPSKNDTTSPRYVHVDRHMVHEFGHTLGLHDFHQDGAMDHLDAVMNDGRSITDHDIHQLRAVYFRHTKD